MPWGYIGGTEGIDLHILNPSFGWRWVVSFMPRLLYLWGKSLWCPLDMRLGGPQSWSGSSRRKKNLVPQPGLNPSSSLVQPISHHYTDWAISACNVMQSKVYTMGFSLMSHKLLNLSCERMRHTCSKLGLQRFELLTELTNPQPKHSTQITADDENVLSCSPPISGAFVGSWPSFIEIS
jgi:hypothetical protein